ncbi:MAG: hypothetical protein ACYC7E_15120 [Armatimonadota bacterium]
MALRCCSSRSSLSWIGWLAVLLACVMPARAQGPVVHILENGGNPVIAPGPEPVYLEALDTLGLRVGFPNPDKVVPLSWEQLRRYPMVILPTAPNQNTVYGNTGDGEGINELLERYLREGGGILMLCPPYSAFQSEHNDINAFLKPHGAQLVWATIDDEQHKLTNPVAVPWQLPHYLWTANITPSPITEGVKTLFFSNNTFRSPSVRPITVSDDWQVLVRTEASAVTTMMTDPIGVETPVQKIKGTEKTGAQALLAVRQVGKGRLAVFSLTSAPYYYDLGKPVGGEVVSKVGDGRRTSDWLPLLRNLCVWLSEPARAAGYPGGAKERGKFIYNPQYGYRDPIDWNAPELSFSDQEIWRLCTMHCGPWDSTAWRDMLGGRYHAYKFLVGARSGRSGGKGTVAEWRGAARAAGFDGVVFREDILKMTKAQWEAFEEECKTASDDSFMAVPGWQWTDWEGNTFLMFNRHLPYYKTERLNKEKTAVQDQEMFYFDAGWPANLPLFVKGNPEAFWNYRLYSSIPVAVYKDGKQVEDNRAEFAALTTRNEFPAPVAVHLLNDPAQVAKATEGMHFMLLAPSLRDLETNPRWQSFGMGTGIDNTVSAYASAGPVIDAFLPLNMYRTTLGSRGVPGSYRYRILVRAHSDTPIARVELWGGDQCLRRYKMDSRQVTLTIDEQHDMQRGLWLKVVDKKGREAIAGKIGAHDKMLVFNWCGDHCNALPWGMGVDAKGNPGGIGLVTHPKSTYSPGGGPGASHAEGLLYIAHGTDTSAPGLGLRGELSLIGADAVRLADHMYLVADVHFRYGTRDMLMQRQVVDRWADLKKYTREYYGYGGWLTGWGPYFKTDPTPDFDIIQDDIDFHHDPGQPAFQLSRGEVRFKREVTLSEKTVINLVLGKMGWGTVKYGMSTATGPLPQPGKLEARLGKGNYLSWQGDWGHGTLFALDDDFAAHAALDAAGKQAGMMPTYGYSLGLRTFKPGETFTYQFLIMRWPVGSKMDDRLDLRVQRALNLTGQETGVRWVTTQGAVVSTQFIQDLTVDAKKYAFRGTLVGGEPGLRTPVRVSGLNPNWTAGLWRAGLPVFAPVGVDPDGKAWLSVDPKADGGSELFIGNLLVCDQPGIILRAFQRNDGGWDLVAHNPTNTGHIGLVRGAAGGPLAGHKHLVSLKPGAEDRWTVK